MFWYVRYRIWCRISIRLASSIIGIGYRIRVRIRTKCRVEILGLVSLPSSEPLI